MGLMSRCLISLRLSWNLGVSRRVAAAELLVCGRLADIKTNAALSLPSSADSCWISDVSGWCRLSTVRQVGEGKHCWAFAVGQKSEANGPWTRSAAFLQGNIWSAWYSDTNSWYKRCNSVNEVASFDSPFGEGQRPPRCPRHRPTRLKIHLVEGIPKM